MQQVVLTIHLIIAICLIVAVLLQRSEGGALGIGGGGGGLVSGRSAATALSKVTWALAIAFIATSLTLTVLSVRGRGASSVIDAAGDEAPAAPGAGDGLGFTPALPDLGDGPAPPPADGPLAPPPAE